MRTKTLLLTAALAAAGIASSLAQSVYSVNAVGYINVTCIPGNTAIANQLITTNNNVTQLFATPPEGSQLLIWDQAALGFTYNNYSLTYGDGWEIKTQTLDPGQGVMFSNPDANNYVVTFVGEVPQSTNLTVKLISGINFVSSMVPQKGLVSSDLGYPIANGDQILKWNQSILGWDYFNFDTNYGGWDPAEPTFEVGEAIVISAIDKKDWTRSFTIN